MQLAIVAADFTPGEADRLRRSMAAWRRSGSLRQFEHKLKSGMTRNGYSLEFADAIYRQILGFGEYGFPESHSASFALLVYVSSWLKCHRPAAFCAALLNSQPMGFYSPSQLVQDARRHGVEVRPPDVTASDWDCTLEQGAVRLGLRMMSGLSEAAGRRIFSAKPFSSVADLAHRAALTAGGSSAPRALERCGRRAPSAARCAGDRAPAGARAAARRRGHHRRLRQPRADSRPPPARAAAKPFAQTSTPHRGRTSPPLPRQHRACCRAGHLPAASRHRERRDLRHARGRNRLHQRGGVESSGRAAAQRAARRAAAGSAGRDRARRRGRASGRTAPVRSQCAAGTPGGCVTRFPLRC